MNQVFKFFNPQKDSEATLPSSPGIYIIVLRHTVSQLPAIGIEPTFHNFSYEGRAYKVVYIGISSNIKRRDYKQHFTGNNAGRSTLRKSLGSLMGFTKIPRDNSPVNNKTKFNEADENHLSQWMATNLLLFFCTVKNAEKDQIKIWEKTLINQYNPPLNIQSNKNEENKSYRDALKNLRK